MTALDKLKKKNTEGKFICVGLDTDINKIPLQLRTSENPVLEFNKRIVDKTYDGAAAYKLNFAFYEADGNRGLDTLQKTLEFIPNEHLLIADAKRGDIGNTSKMYAKSVYDYYDFDSITINPYMGEDSVLPFLEDSRKLNFILALTSNPGSADFEKLKLEDGSFLFQKVIEKVKRWNVNKNCAIVFGATNISELKDNIGLFGDLPVLLPGVGAQGGSLEDIIETFKNSHRLDLIVNVSRGIIYKSSTEDFAGEAKKELDRFNSIVKSILNE